MEDTDIIQDYTDVFKQEIQEKLKQTRIRDKALNDFTDEELFELTSLPSNKLFKLLIRYLKARNTRTTSREFVDDIESKARYIKQTEDCSFEQAKILAFQDMKSRLSESEAIMALPTKAKNEKEIRIKLREKEKNNNE